MAVIAVIIDGNGSRIDSMAQAAAVDGGSNNGVFTTASHDDIGYSHPHCPHCPCPP